MKLLKTIFLFEWLQLKRQPVQYLALGLFFIIGCSAIWSGRATVQKQHLVIDSLRHQYKTEYGLALKKFTDTLTPEAKAQAAYAGMAQIINFRLAPLAVNEPAALAALSVGQRDINPYYQKVKSSVDFLDQGNVEISNPAKLFAGNFDLSFVLIYLLPLLVIAFYYNAVSEEKEQGTYALISIQATGTRMVLIYKLLFRFCVIFMLLVLLNALGFLVAGSSGKLPGPAVLVWLWLIFIYTFFWFTVCYLVLQFSTSSINSAMQMVGVWLFFLILLPSLTNSYLGLKYPTQLRTSLASHQRHLSEEVWSTKPIILADSFSRFYPQYNASRNPAKDSTRSGERFIVGYYELLERKMVRYAGEFNRQLELKNLAAAKLSVLNPSIKLQYLFNGLAGTGRNDYRSFQNEVSNFQRRWKHHLYRYQLVRRHFTPQELETLPEFKRDRSTHPGAVLKGSLSLLAAALLLLIFSFIIQKTLRSRYVTGN